MNTSKKLVFHKIQLLQQKLINGGKVYLYEDVYLPVDSTIVNESVTEEFSIGYLRQLA